MRTLFITISLLFTTTIMAKPTQFEVHIGGRKGKPQSATALFQKQIKRASRVQEAELVYGLPRDKDSLTAKSIVCIREASNFSESKALTSFLEKNYIEKDINSSDVQKIQDNLLIESAFEAEAVLTAINIINGNSDVSAEDAIKVLVRANMVMDGVTESSDLK